VSTEITGYGISTLAYLYGRTRDHSYRESALRAGRFLTRTAWDPAAATFPFEYSPGSEASGQPPAYFFDCGIIARGLVALWRATGDREFLDSAIRCAESMARDFVEGDEVHPVLLLPGKTPAAREPRWSRNPGCYQLKAGLAWHELSEEAGVSAFRPFYEKLLARALDTHSSFLPGEQRAEGVMDRLHAYCYFLEGVLPEAARPECLRALREGVGRVGCLLREIAPVFERSDVGAQLLRVRLLAASMGAIALDEGCAREEAGRIAGFHLNDQDQRIAGGFAFGRQGSRMLPHVNPVSTAFCLQALEMWREHQTGSCEPEWRTLI
jgi:hypothetical protein